MKKKKTKNDTALPYHLVIVGFGLLIRQKYIPIINVCYKKGLLTSVSIVELQNQEEMVKRRIGEFGFDKVEVFYTSCDSIDPFRDYIEELQIKYKRVKVVIATEVKAHEQYLDFCINHQIECLVEKPVIATMNNGMFEPKLLSKKMSLLVKKAKKSKTSHSVMCFSRNHTFYNDVFLDQIDAWVRKYNTPLTSIHLHTNSGIWNLNHEYVSREDHPYKFGYGMLMHGAYHYVDIFAQMIKRNLKMFPDDKFKMYFSTYGVFPHDQEHRIPTHVGALLEEDPNYFASEEFKKYKFGETDLCSSFSLVNVTKNKTLTIGTLSFEQTSPGMRNWKELPDDVYNKNGRTSHTDIVVQLATLCAMQIQSYKVKDVTTGEDKYIATKLTRTNSAILSDETNCELTEYGDFSNSNANQAMLTEWLNNREQKSTLESHELTMKITAVLAQSLTKQGKRFTLTIPKSSWK